MGKKLTISIDMGAKNNGVFIVKSEGKAIESKKASCIVVDNINFSKVSRTHNRHKDRNYKRRDMAKKLLAELVDIQSFNEEQQELVRGLLNNRGYTFLSTATEFEMVTDETVEFLVAYIEPLLKQKIKDEFEAFLTNEFDDEEELLEFLERTITTITAKSSELESFTKKRIILSDIEALESRNITKFKAFSYIKGILFKYEYRDLGKNQDAITKALKKEDIDLSKIDFEKEKKLIASLEFDAKSVESKKEIVDDLKLLKAFLQNVEKEIKTGSKPRKKYLSEIKDEIDELSFIENKEAFYNLVGNISNLQLRVLRKFYNNNSKHRDKYKILKNYFLTHHYKSEKERSQRKALFTELNKYSTIEEFFKSTNPTLTIPPYEDMNNRDTYKCNSMLINPELIDDTLKESIDFLLKQSEFDRLTISQEGEFKKENLVKGSVVSGNKLIKRDFTYSKYLQRIFDATEEVTTKELNPRNVFKYKKTFERGEISSVEMFKRVFGERVYKIFEPIAERYYREESKIMSGIYEESTFMFVKCNTNTPYKDNVKEVLLKPIYSYAFTKEEAEKFLIGIENSRGLKASMQRIADEAKRHQNAFYHVVQACYENEKCINDKDIKSIVNNIESNFQLLKSILENELEIKNSYFKDVPSVTAKNLSRVLNIFKQTYEILFKDLKGFSKTCKHCSQENALRSDENYVIGKRLLSDVAKPIDGMLDMMLDRIAYEITEEIGEADISDVVDLEILLEQNRFEFEDGLLDIKKKSKLSDTERVKREKFQKLNVNVCPYSGKSFAKGDYDHILPQSKGIYNSKANMIYVSTEGNQKIKGARVYTLEMIASEHLKALFKTDELPKIREIIKIGIESIKKEEFKNFDNLKLHQQIAMRYALFMRDTEEFNKAFELLKLDKLKTITNGTQKRLARFVYEKLVEKFPKSFENEKIDVHSKTVNSELVSTTRNILAESQKELEKPEIQDSHSHCIDAMVVFYLANAKIKGHKHRQKENLGTLEPMFGFDEVYLSESKINRLSKKRTFITSLKKEQGSYPLFDSTIYSESYYHIKKDELKEKEITLLIEHGLLYHYVKNRKESLSSVDELMENHVYKIDVEVTSNLLYKLFLKADRERLSQLKFLDDLRYSTSRKEIEDIFFDKTKTKLLSFEAIKAKNKNKTIPRYSQKLYKAVYKKLNDAELFKDVDGKKILESEKLNHLLRELFESKQSDESKKERKRGKKRHKYTLPILGSPNFRINRGNSWQVLGNKDISAKWYIIDGEIKPIPFFSKNTIPLKITDLLDCLLIDEQTKSIYEVNVEIKEISEYVSKLKYLVTSKDKMLVIVTLKKEAFYDIDFNNFTSNGVDCKYEIDKGFKQLVSLYLNRILEKNEQDILQEYIGKLRNEKNKKDKTKYTGSAKVLENLEKTITIQYTAFIQKKKQIILENLK